MREPLFSGEALLLYAVVPAVLFEIGELRIFAFYPDRIRIDRLRAAVFRARLGCSGRNETGVREHHAIDAALVGELAVNFERDSVGAFCERQLADFDPAEKTVVRIF